MEENTKVTLEMEKWKLKVEQGVKENKTPNENETPEEIEKEWHD